MGAILPITIFAQTGIATSAPQGYLSRGILMHDNQNYEGAIDQLTHLKSLPMDACIAEKRQLYVALSLARQGSPAAPYALKQYLKEYPFSVSAPEAWMTLGNYYFFDGKFGEAIQAYERVGNNAFNSDRNDDLVYRIAYCRLRLGDYDSAKAGFARLAHSSRYRSASTFYDAYILYANKNYDQALNTFMRVDRKGDLGYNAQYYLCQIYFKKGEFAKVRSLGTALLADNNHSDMDSEINRILGEADYHEGDDASAYKYITKYLDSNDTAPMRTAEYILGVIDYRRGDYSLAVEHLGDVTEEQNALGQSAYYYLGQAYRKQGNMPLAAMAFEKACKMDYSTDTQEAAFYNYAVMQNEGSRTPFSKTIDMFEDFLNRFPNSRYTPDVEEYMVGVYTTGNDYSRALTSISHIANPSARVLKAKQTVLYNLGVESLSNGQSKQATQYFTEARNLGKYDSRLANQANLWLGECYYRAANYSAAEKCLNAYVNDASENDANYSLGNYDLGYSLFQQRKYADARTAFERAVKSGSLQPKLKSDANNRIGDTYYYAKNFSSAENYYDQSYDENATGGDYALYQKAMMLGLNKKYSDKVAKIDEMLHKYPNSPMAPNAMLEQADACVLMGNNKKATAIYEDLLRRYPSTATARKGLLQLAITERNMGNESAAIDTYKKVISKYPTSDEASAAAEDLKVIYADRGTLQEYAAFMGKIPNAPKIDVSEIDKLSFEAAEKAFLAEKPDVSKMRAYLKKYPDGAYAANAKYYLAKLDYQRGNYTKALDALESVLSTNGDAPYAEDAMSIKSDILLKQGKDKEALDTYKALVSKASTPDSKTVAQLGVLLTSAKMEKYDDVVATADELLKNGGLTAEEENEVRLARARAYSKLHKGSLAEKDFAQLAKDTRNVYGAQSAYYLAQEQYDAGNLKDAEKTLNSFIDSGTPHQYWLARGFILLSDIYHKRGADFEACQYLESLKSNYPGKDSDIFSMIQERLGKWKGAAKDTKSNKKK